MINRLKLWISRHDKKILTVILVIVIAGFLIKGTNKHFQNIVEESKQNAIEKEETISNLTSNPKVYEWNLDEMESSDDEYKKVISVEKKIFNDLYLARKNDDLSIKKRIFNYCTEDFKSKATLIDEKITPENILDSLSKVENVDYYTVEKVYSYSENNNVKRYVLRISCDNGGPAIVGSYMVINMDFNNDTFSYEGEVTSLNYIDVNKKIDSIENTGGNTF